MEYTTEELQQYIAKAVQVFEENASGELDAFWETFTTAIEDYELATNLYRFIPVAYCRMTFPQYDYPDHYCFVRASDKQLTDHKFADNELYQEAIKFVEHRIETAFNKQAFSAVLMHSSTFKTISQIIQQEGNPEEYEFSPPMFLLE